jgi:hypothetical protein
MVRFVYLRLMGWKLLQGLFQIHIINYLIDFLTIIKRATDGRLPDK